jgi:phosphoesterase RecJ-like protein
MKVEDGLVWTSISESERLETGHNGSSSFGLGNMMANAYGAMMSAVLLDLGNGRVSVGFRCNPPFRVSELAESFGGGGHHLAAGCTIEAPLSEAEMLVVSRSKEIIRNHQASD